MVRADWDKVYPSFRKMWEDLNIEEPPEIFEDKFKKRGGIWIEGRTDTLLVLPSLTMNKKDDQYQSVLHVHCWNDPDARKKIAELLGLPVETV